MRALPYLLAVATLALTACTSTPPPYAPSVSVVNSLSFDHPMTGKRDGLRSAWPMDQLGGATEQFPMAQVKHCDAAGLCRWGVLKAYRRVGSVRQVPNGIAIDVEVAVDIERSQRASATGLQAAMTIPNDVAALELKRTEKRELVLPFGQVHRIDFGHGIHYELCALRLTSARQSVDQCEIAYH